ncbi:hypothetical protein B0H14DRAFT_3442846 [Mycena olivaceomarginata]|nr:hypothetical protein B0H14DRAFT_3442846 [Mycena olivaceomarginata]
MLPAAPVFIARLSTSSRLGNMYTLPMAITCALSLRRMRNPRRSRLPPSARAGIGSNRTEYAYHADADRPTLVATPGAGRCESGDSDSAGDEAGLDRDQLRMLEREEVRARLRIGAGREVRRRATRPSSLDAYTPRSLLRPCPCAYQFQLTSRDPLRFLGARIRHSVPTTLRLIRGQGGDTAAQTPMADASDTTWTSTTGALVARRSSGDGDWRRLPQLTGRMDPVPLSPIVRTRRRYGFLMIPTRQYFASPAPAQAGLASPPAPCSFGGTGGAVGLARSLREMATPSLRSPPTLCRSTSEFESG